MSRSEINDTSTEAKIRFTGNLLMAEITGVGALEHHHSIIVSQRPIELAIPDIHGIDPRRAIFFNMQSVKPPVEAPISMHIFSSKQIENSAIAFSNLRPPRLT